MPSCRAVLGFLGTHVVSGMLRLHLLLAAVGSGEELMDDGCIVLE